MADELSIQPQVIQERKRDNSAAYGLGGVAAGGVGGYFASNLIKKPMSYQEIINDANAADRATFSNKYEKAEATWKEVMEKADEVKKLKSDFEKIPEKLLAEGSEEANLKEAAQKAYDAEFKRLVNAEKGTNIKSIPTLKDLEKDGIYIQAKDGVKVKDRKGLYIDLRDEYRNTLANVRKSAEYKEYGSKITSTENAYKNLIENLKNDYEAAKIADSKMSLKKFFVEKDGSEKSKIYEKIRSAYDAQLRKTGKYTVGNKGGEKAIKTRSHEMAVQTLEDMKKYIEAIDRKASIKSKIDAAQLKAAGVKDVDAVLTKSVAQYQRELNTLTNSSLPKEHLKARNDLINNLTKEYGCTKDELEKIINKRINIAKRFESVDGTINEILGRSKSITDFYVQQRSKLVDSETKTVLNKLQKAFPEIFKKKNGETASISEIEAKVTEKLKDSEVGKKLAEAIEKYNAAAEKSGVTNEAKKTAKEALEKAEAAFKETAEKLADKMPKVGFNKWLGAAIGAAALGIAAFGIAKANSKDA